MLYGAIAGDISGSRHEFRRIKTEDFDLFDQKCIFTDDTVLTVAVAECILEQADVTDTLKKYATKYPHAGYGGMFVKWVQGATGYKPYQSFGNGSAMRVSPVGFAATSWAECMEDAEASASVTHNHPEGIKGAQATAGAIFLARMGSTKEEIRERISQEFNYDLSSSVEALRPRYTFDATCQGSVPQSIICFLDGNSWEDTVRKAISLGGDTDTMACIAGGIAEAFYGDIDEVLTAKIKSYLPDEFIEIVDKFNEKFNGARQ